MNLIQNSTNGFHPLLDSYSPARGRQASGNLEVKAIGASQIWSEPIEYSFFIAKPWWLTWWAYLGYFIVVSLLIFVSYRYWSQRQYELMEIHRLLKV